MKLKLHFAALLTLFLLSGCQSTTKLESHYAQAETDYALMLMLVNRPVTGDQLLMDQLARRSYTVEQGYPKLFYLPAGQIDPVNFISVSFTDALLSPKHYPSLNQLNSVTLRGPENSL